MFICKLFSVIVVLIGLHNVVGYPHPHPFVSSSGMIPMHPRKNATNESTTSTSRPISEISLDTKEITISEEDEGTSEIPPLRKLPPPETPPRGQLPPETPPRVLIPETTTDMMSMIINMPLTPDVELIPTQHINPASYVQPPPIDNLPNNSTELEPTLHPTETKSPVVIHKIVDEIISPEKNVTKRKVDELPPDLGAEPEKKVQVRPHRQNDYNDMDNMDMVYAENVDDETSDPVPPPPPLPAPAVNSSVPQKLPANSPKPATSPTPAANSSKPAPLPAPPAPTPANPQKSPAQPSYSLTVQPSSNASIHIGTSSGPANEPFPPPLLPSDPLPPMFQNPPAKKVDLTVPTHSLLPPMKQPNVTSQGKDVVKLPFQGQTFDEKANLKHSPKFDYDAEDKPEEIETLPLNVNFNEDNTVGNSPRSEDDDHDDESEETQQINQSFDEHAEPAPNMTTVGVEETTPEPPYPKYLIGAPWDDEQIVGEMSENEHIPKIEISFNLAAKLCQSITAQNEGAPAPPQYYLWAPILQYVPLIHKPYPLRSPIFTHECLKWVLHQCRGPSKLPMVQPCTYWAPMRINRPECGFSPHEFSKMVNYRQPDHVPGHCPCVWPCERRFDPIQRCRVNTSNHELEYDDISSTGEPSPLTEIRIQENYAKQLCRSMATATTSNPITISALPIRTGAIVKHKENKNLVKKRHVKSKQYKPLHKRSDDGSDEFDFTLTTSFDTYGEGEESKVGANTGSTRDKTSKKTHGIGVGQIIDDVSSHEESDALMTITFNPDPAEAKTSEESTPVYLPTDEHCLVWEYKVCDKGSSEEDSKETYELPKRVKRGARNAAAQKKRKGKGRSLIFQAFDEDDDYDTVVGNKSLDARSFLSLIFNEEKSAVAAGEGDISPDDKGVQNNDISDEEFNIDCGKWESKAVEDCYPETLPDMSRIKDTPQTVRDVCDGSDDKFPCFTRRKRDLDDGVEHNWSEEAANEGESGPNGENPPPKEKGPKAENKSQEENEVPDDKKPDKPKDPNDDDDSHETDTALVVTVQLQPGGNDTEKSVVSSPFENKVKVLPDPICRCDWPCLPFYDNINKCYDDNGSVLVTPEGKPVVPVRSFRKYQRGPVICMNFVDSDNIVCKVKGKKKKNSLA